MYTRPPRLIPAPASLSLTGGRCSLQRPITIAPELSADASIVLDPVFSKLRIRSNPPPPGSTPFLSITPSSGSSPESYELTVLPESMRIIAPGPAGARHALRTLAQLLTEYGTDLPTLHIKDQPAISTRGVMLDISRDKVPTQQSLYEAIDLLASLKINHLQLYTEHTFAYAGHEDIWQSASPITPDEARALDTYCRIRGIELCPNQNTLGHLSRWLRHPRYAPLAETHDEWTFETDDRRPIHRSGPFSLCPVDPGSIELLRDWLGQLLPCFESDHVNIGCDEAFDIGAGRSREAVLARGRVAVYFEHLLAVSRIAAAHGKSPLFWGDIALRHPVEEWRSLVPDYAIPLLWGYEADAPFTEWINRLDVAGLRAWVCPGTSSWRSITGRSSVRRSNVAAAAQAFSSSACHGFLLTDWGDMGHRQHWPIALHSIAHGAHTAWCGPQGSPFDPQASAIHLLHDRSGALGAWIEELGDCDAALRTRLYQRNTNALFHDLHAPLASDCNPESTGSISEWENIGVTLAQLRSRLEATDPTGCSDLVRSELEHTLWVAEHAVNRALVRRACAGRRIGAVQLIRLEAEIGAIIEDHRALWSKRNRPGGLDDSCAYYEQIAQEYAQASGAPPH